MTTTKLSWLFASALLAACSGATTGVGAGGDGDGGSSSGGTDDAGACTDISLAGERVCVPGTAKAGTALMVAIDGTGCVACGGSLLPCQVAVSGTIITITATERDCPTDGICSASCALPQTTCTIPALPAGTYEVKFANETLGEDTAGRELVVTDAATATSCTLPVGDPPPIAAKDFPQDCNGDGDCTVVSEGSACSVCSCPSAAIATSALADYQAASRERAAECRSTGAISDCAPCAQLLPHCNAGKCEARATK